jgi:NitT/TauT family transport system ATP-binding protein
VPKERALNKNVCDDFRLFRLQGSENSYPRELSGGMQQRVAIIRALQSQPDILYCDEPFSAIDFVTRLYLNTEFKKISRNIGCTTVFVTHNIEEAIFLADRILVLNGSPCKIVADIVPQLSDFQEDAVKCRLTPEFARYFNEIWVKLEPGYK